jgi:hypothetical protein
MIIVINCSDKTILLQYENQEEERRIERLLKYPSVTHYVYFFDNFGSILITYRYDGFIDDTSKFPLIFSQFIIPRIYGLLSIYSDTSVYLSLVSYFTYTATLDTTITIREFLT